MQNIRENKETHNLNSFDPEIIITLIVETYLDGEQYLTNEYIKMQDTLSNNTVTFNRFEIEQAFNKMESQSYSNKEQTHALNSCDNHYDISYEVFNAVNNGTDIQHHINFTEQFDNKKQSSITIARYEFEDFMNNLKHIKLKQNLLSTA